MEKRVSLKDIATKLGVSTALVSYVLNGKEKEKRVGTEIAEKIRKTAKEMNYMPNQIARSLRKGSTNTIGLIVTDIANPFFSSMARIAEDEAAKLGYTVMFCSSDEDCYKSSLEIDTLVNRRVDGLIIVPAEGCTEQIETLIRKKIPVVLIDRYIPELATNYVVLDNYSAAFEATTHLIQQGYSKIGMIAYQSSLIHMKERVRGYKEAMEKNNLGKNIWVEKVQYKNTQIDMEKAIDNFCMGNNKASALLFATNMLSIRGLYTINKKNLKVPEDIGIIGFDGIEAFDFFYSPVTYIKQPVDEMVKEAFNILIAQIKGSEKRVRITLNHKLIQRQSSMKPTSIANTTDSPVG